MKDGKYLVPTIIIVAGIVLVFIYYSFAYTGLSSSPELGVYLGNKAIDFQFTDFNGNSYRLSDFKGRVVVLEFMASWCPPCKVQVQYLRELRQLYSEDKLVIISISLDTDEYAARQFWTEHKVTWIMSRNVTIGSTYGVYYIPTIIVIDKDGIIRYRNEGLATTEDLSSIINQYL